MGLQNCKCPHFGNFESPNLGILGQNDIWVQGPWPTTYNIIRGKVVIFPKSMPSCKKRGPCYLWVGWGHWLKGFGKPKSNKKLNTWWIVQHGGQTSTLDHKNVILWAIQEFVVNNMKDFINGWQIHELGALGNSFDSTLTKWLMWQKDIILVGLLP